MIKYYNRVRVLGYNLSWVQPDAGKTLTSKAWYEWGFQFSGISCHVYDLHGYDLSKSHVETLPADAQYESHVC